MAIIPNFPQDLADLHHAWHRPLEHPGLPTRIHLPGTAGAGLEFLQFHRDFMRDVRAWYDVQPFADPAAVAPWLAIPQEIKNSSQWNASLAAQEQRITSNNPPFASEDDLGAYIENGIHNWIHGATAIVFNEMRIGGFHSPESTYFYKIHGLVDHWWSVWKGVHKTAVKDVIDTKANFKELVKEHKELVPEGKQQFKENLKELPDKPFKEKDKDLVEGGGLPNEVVDPIIQRLADRIQTLEVQTAMGRAFIQRAERPDVGGQAMEDDGGRGGEGAERPAKRGR